MFVYIFVVGRKESKLLLRTGPMIEITGGG